MLSHPSQGKRLGPSLAALEEDVSLGLGDEIQRFDVPVATTNGTGTVPEHIEHVASYSWLNETVPVPSMAVPGTSPRWREPAVGMRLRSDRENSVGQEQDADVVPKWPLLALVAAVQHERGPEYPMSSVDIVTARNSLRRLLRWIRSGGRRGGSFEFRIDVDIVGRHTMLLSRRELRDNEHHVRRAHGYGLSFERVATFIEDDVKTDDGNGYMRYMGYNRIVRYSFGGLSMMVRSEVDACIQDTPAYPPPPAPSSASSSVPAMSDPTSQALLQMLRLSLSDEISPVESRAMSPESATSQSDTRSSLRSPDGSLFSFYEHPSAASSLSSIDVSSTLGDADAAPRSPLDASSKPKPASLDPIRVISGGRRVDQRDLVELTTCFNEQFPKWDELADQTVLCGVTRVHVGFYNKTGVLTKVGKFTQGYYRLATARSKNATSYDQLARLLHAIRECALQHRGKRLSLACLNGRLALYERSDDKVALPTRYLAMFDR